MCRRNVFCRCLQLTYSSRRAGAVLGTRTEVVVSATQDYERRDAPPYRAIVAERNGPLLPALARAAHTGPAVPADPCERR